MKERYENLLENLNLVYRLKEQAEAAQHQSELMLRGVRSVLEAESADDLYRRMFRNFHNLIPYDICLILQQSEPGYLLCTSATLEPVIGERWQIGEMLKQTVNGKTLAMFNASMHPDWATVPLPASANLKSMLFSPFIIKDELAVIVFAHTELGFYTQEHVHIASRYREFTEQTLLSVNARLLALESEQLKRDKARVEQSLIASEKMASVGLLAAGVAHEINNPVGFVSSNIEYLKESLPTLNEFTKHLNALFTAADDASRLSALQQCQQWYASHDVDQLLADIGDICTESDEGLQRVADITTSLRSFTRTDPKDSEAFCVNKTITDTLPLVRSELKHHVKIIQHLKEVPTVLGSPRKLGQVLINLLVNAGQAIVSHGTITIETGTERDDNDMTWIIIRVSDTGCGISQKALDNIFQPFYTTKPVGLGTGLGLYISLTIMKSMGGDIKVSSVINQGTIFTLYLPGEDTRQAQSGASCSD